MVSRKDKKAEGMSVGLMVAIAIGVAIIVLMYFLIFRGGKNVSIAGSCEEKFCTASEGNEGCGAISGELKKTYVAGLTTCKVGEKSGKCCVPEDFS